MIFYLFNRSQRYLTHKIFGYLVTKENLLVKRVNYLFKTFKMFFSIVIIISVISVLQGQDYLKNCKYSIDFQSLCLEYSFNEINCFPWDKSLCRIVSISNDNYHCIDWKCNVILLLKYQLFKKAKYFISCFCYQH